MLMIERQLPLDPSDPPLDHASPQRDPLGLTPIPEDHRQRFLRFVLAQKKRRADSARSNFRGHPTGARRYFSSTRSARLYSRRL